MGVLVGGGGVQPGGVAVGLGVGVAVAVISAQCTVLILLDDMTNGSLNPVVLMADLGVRLISFGKGYRP